MTLNMILNSFFNRRERSLAMDHVNHQVLPTIGIPHGFCGTKSVVIVEH